MNKRINNSAVITNTRYSTFARLKPVPINNISLLEGFWLDRIRKNNSITIFTQYEQLESTGGFDNFRRLTKESPESFQGFVFNDSDVYKWLEAASWIMASQHNCELQQLMDDVISIIVKAQDRNGYINTYFSFEHTSERWSNLREKHELYCAGHLIQAAIAHYRVTGERKLLDVAISLADLIDSTFGLNRGEGTSGHPEIEMALVELFRTTRDEKYLDLAALFIDRRGHQLLGGSEYLLDHIPFRDLEFLSGHAVRALYLCSGATDVALETGEDALITTLSRLWKNLVEKQVYITGGVGARYDGEVFGKPYELPNARAYAETCAAIASVMWNWRMLQIDGNAKYADLLEWTFFNAVLPGISINAQEYFYVNPLMDDGSHRRKEWFLCACCPPNICRTLAMYPGYMYSVSKEGIWLHLFANSIAKIDMMTGTQVELEQTSNYPWEGKISLQINKLNTINPNLGIQDIMEEFSLFLRIPGWVGKQDASVHINGENYSHLSISGKYLEIRRNWKAGDEITVEIPIAVNIIESHPYILENTRRIAITRGPLLYCVEQVDNPDAVIPDISLNLAASPSIEFDQNLLGGVVKIILGRELRVIDSKWENKLYFQLQPEKRVEDGQSVEVIAIPYYGWANRMPGPMAIWHSYK
jgi:DUF1680 family protein